MPDSSVLQKMYGVIKVKGTDNPEKSLALSIISDLQISRRVIK